ncbi:hypothetical protein D3C83_112180 [compost metagenome]
MSTLTEPLSSAFTRPDPHSPRTQGKRPRNQSYGTIAVSRWKNESTAVTTVAQNTEYTGEKPISMKPTMETSETK